MLFQFWRQSKIRPTIQRTTKMILDLSVTETLCQASFSTYKSPILIDCKAASFAPGYNGLVSVPDAAAEDRKC